MRECPWHWFLLYRQITASTTVYTAIAFLTNDVDPLIFQFGR